MQQSQLAPSIESLCEGSDGCVSCIRSSASRFWLPRSHKSHALSCRGVAAQPRARERGTHGHTPTQIAATQVKNEATTYNM